MKHALQWLAALALTFSLVSCASPQKASSPPQHSVAAAAEKPTASAAPTSPLPVNPDDPTWGDTQAPVTIFYFSDFECPFCQRVHPTIEKLKQKYGPKKLRIAFNHTPLPFHKRAKPTAYAAVAVHQLAGNDAFWKFAEQALSNQKALTERNLGQWAQDAGIAHTTFIATRNNPTTSAKVKADLTRAQRAGIDGTPGFLINGKLLVGAQPSAQFEAIIDEEIEAVTSLIAEGTAPAHASAKRTIENFKLPKQKVDRIPEETEVWRVAVQPDDPQRGPRDALVTIVQWSDFQCPYCSRAEATLDKLFEAYGDDLRLVWKDLPLSFHKQAQPAANLAREAFAQGGNDKFWRVHRLLYRQQENLGEGTYQQITKDAGLSWDRAKKALDQNAHDRKIRQSKSEAVGLGVRGTPHFFINGRRLAGAVPFAEFKKIIDEQLSQAKALVAQGTPRANVYDTLMKTAKAPPGPEWREPPTVPSDAPQKGNPKAKVVLQLFSDFECPFCQRITPTLSQVMQTYGNQVQLVWRNMPLSMHSNAQLAAEAAHEVYLQKGDAAFWTFHDLLFSNQDDLKRADLERYAVKVGANQAALARALDARTHQKRIQQDVADATAARINGTPVTFINGYVLSGAQALSRYERVIDYALKHPTPPKE